MRVYGDVSCEVVVWCTASFLLSLEAFIHELRAKEDVSRTLFVKYTRIEESTCEKNVGRRFDLLLTRAKGDGHCFTHSTLQGCFPAGWFIAHEVGGRQNMTHSNCEKVRLSATQGDTHDMRH